MADDKKIRVGIDNSAFESYESKMRQSAEGLAREMIKSSRSYTTSAKETLSSIEEQIRAIEKRNALDKEFREREISASQESGSLSAPQAKARMAGVVQDSKSDKLQIQLLKEVVNAIKSTSRQEIREDRVGIEKQLATSRTVNQLSPKGDPLELLKESIQQQYLSELNTEEVSQKGFSGQSIQQYGMLPVQFAGARNMLDMAGGAANTAGGMLGKMGGAGGIAGMLIALTAGKLIQTVGGSAENLEGALGDWSRLGGGSVRHYDPSGFNVRGLARHGMTISDYISGRAGLETSAKTSDFGESAMNLMQLSKGTMLSEGDVSGLVELRRHGGGTATGTSNFFEQYLKQSGQSMAVLPEIIQQFTSEARNIIMQTGKVDTAGLASLMTTVGGQTGFHGELLGGAMSTLGKGMQRSSNPVLQAMQFRAARGAAGSGASLWDIEKMMADPLSNPEYMQSMLTSLKETSGGGQAYERALSNMLGINPNQASAYANIDLSKKLTKERLIEINEESISQSGKSAKSLGSIKEGSATLEGAREKYGFEAAQKISEGLLTMSANIGKFLESTGEIVDKIDVMMQGGEKTMKYQEHMEANAEATAATWANGNKKLEQIYQVMLSAQRQMATN